MNRVRFRKFLRLLSCFLAESFPFRTSRVLMNLLLKVISLKELWRKFPHNRPHSFLSTVVVPWPFLILHGYGLIIHTYPFRYMCTIKYRVTIILGIMLGEA